jgi:hypothetical protein
MRAIRLTVAFALMSIAAMGGGSLRADDATAPQPAPAAPQQTAPQPKKTAVPVPTVPADTTPPSVTVIEAVDAHGILGRDVRSAADEDMGRIADVIVDRDGVVRGAVIDFGGFLGVGTRKIVVDWAALHFWNVANPSKSITLELTRDQVKAAPEYKDDQPIIVLGASGKLEPLRFRPRTTEK